MFVLVASLSSGGVLPAGAQLSGSLLAEAQVGNIPYLDPADLTTTYTQLNLRYRQQQLAVSVRAEQFYSRFENRNYTELTQYALRYRGDGFRVRLGHYYDLIGRGLLLRAYEIPGTVLESQASRVRQGFYRDLFGFALDGRWKRLRYKVLRGTTLDNTLPPTLDDDVRRNDLVSAVELSYQHGPAELGGAFLRNNFRDDFQEYATVYLNAQLGSRWSVYGEVAQEVGRGHPLLDFGEEQAFAGYGSVNFFAGPLSLSAEYKHYKNFSLSTGFNDPPAVIKQHTYLTLNRSTHVPFLFDEAGFQVDGFYLFSPKKRLTLNVAQTKNDLGGGLDFTYRELFLEYSTPVAGALSAKVFADYAQDPFKQEDHRYTGGFTGAYVFENTLAVSATLEHQWIERDAFRLEDGTPFVEGLHNTVVRGSVSKGDLRLGFVLEATTDPLQTDRPDTVPIETDRRFFTGVSLGYAYQNRHYVSLFGGTRRGGPACTGGICYEVLDFSGFEARFTSKF